METRHNGKEREKINKYAEPCGFGCRSQEPPKTLNHSWAFLSACSCRIQPCTQEGDSGSLIPHEFVALVTFIGDNRTFGTTRRNLPIQLSKLIFDQTNPQAATAGQLGS